MTNPQVEDNKLEAAAASATSYNYAKSCGVTSNINCAIECNNMDVNSLTKSIENAFEVCVFLSYIE